MQLTISATANIPAKLELSGIAVTGKAIADLVVKVLYADSTDFETLTTTTDVTLDEASDGWYRIIINSAKVDLAGMLLVQISSATLAFDTKEYLHEIVAASAAALIGTPVALDGGTATIAGMLAKMADDNAGGTFDATNDSLNKLAKDSTVSKPGTAQTTDVVSSNHAELGSVPASNASIAAKVEWMFMKMLNGGTMNKISGVEQVYNAAGVAIGAATHADDGTDLDKGKFS